MPASPPRVGHVGLTVRALDPALAFYRDVLDFQLHALSEVPGRRYAFLARDGAVALTLWEQSDHAFAPEHAGLHHLAFQVDDIAQVREIESRLRRRGATIHHGGIVPHGEGRSSGGIFFEDPDGVRLEVYAPDGAATAPAPTPGAPTCGFF